MILLFLLISTPLMREWAFERLMKNWKTGSVEQQNFLLPLTVDLEAEEVEALLDMKAELESMGILIEQSGPSTLSFDVSS